MTKSKSKKPQPIKMRVWWIPQFPMKRFTVEIPESIAPGSANRMMTRFYMVEHAKLLLKALDNYTWVQFDDKVKPDYCNAGGLEVFEDGEWVEWNNEDGHDISEIMRDEART